MSRKNRLIIPIFLPFGGCPQQCVFCDQKGLTGTAAMPGLAEVTATVEAYLWTWRHGGRIEIAFYGGSFTALPEAEQRRYLGAAYRYVSEGRAHSIRVSTRPDSISKEKVELLRSYGVDTVEIGAQSMSDEVLSLSGRGHTSAASVAAVQTLKAAAMLTGVQIMPGLPGDTAASVIETVDKVIGLSPEFVRIYPAVVLKDTGLHRMYLAGAYRPWEMADMVAVCREAALRFKGAGIPIIRMGLQAHDGLMQRLVAGPYHPSFRQLVGQGV